MPPCAQRSEATALTNRLESAAVLPAGLSCWSVQLAWRADGTGEVLAFLPAEKQVRCLE